LYGDLLESGRKEQTGKVNKTAGSSARTVRYIHTIISAILGDAVKKGLLARNVATLASPPSAKSAKAPEGDFWTHDQLRVFLDAAVIIQRLPSDPDPLPKSP